MGEEGGEGEGREEEKKLLESGKCVCVSRSSSLVSDVSYISLLVEASSDGPAPDLPISVLTGHKLLTCNTHHIPLSCWFSGLYPKQSSVHGGTGQAVGAQWMSAVVTRAPLHALPLPDLAHSCHYTLFLEIERWRELN